MGYVTVSFQIHEEDLRKGLTVKWLEVAGEGLVPFTWSYRGQSGNMRHYSSAEPVSIRVCPVHPLGDGGCLAAECNGSELVETKLVAYELYGGTEQQYRHTAEQQKRYCEVHGWLYGGTVHFPKHATDDGCSCIPKSRIFRDPPPGWGKVPGIHDVDPECPRHGSLLRP